jgi:transposase
VLWTGCQWKVLPKDLPPKSTAHWYLMLWNSDGTLERIHQALYVAVREQEGREANPTAAIIDSQSAKGAPKGGLRSIRKAKCGLESHRPRRLMRDFERSRTVAAFVRLAMIKLMLRRLTKPTGCP